MKIYTQRDGKSTQIANFDSVYCLQKQQAKKSMQIANKNANLRRDGGEIYEISPKKSTP